MNTEQVSELIKNIGLCTELWIITYTSFKKQGLNNEEATIHTKAFMSTMFEAFLSSNGNDRKEVK